MQAYTAVCHDVIRLVCFPKRLCNEYRLTLLRGLLTLASTYKLVKGVSNRGAVCRVMANVPQIILLPLCYIFVSFMSHC